MTTQTLTLEELAKLTDSELCGDPQLPIRGVGDIFSATSDQITFLANLRYKAHLQDSTAAAIIVQPDLSQVEGQNYLLNSDPSVAFQKILQAFYDLSPTNPSAFTGIHPTATVADSAILGKKVTVGPNAVIDSGAKIGDHTIIDAGCFVGASTNIGEHCHFLPNVSILERCTIGNHVIVQPGTIIGSSGFGFVQDPEGKHERLEQLGTVIIEDDVEIGASTTIDRARFGATRIGQGSKLGNYNLIAHNVSIGKHCILVGQIGIAGSTHIGDQVMIGGQAAFDGHLYIAPKTKIAARSAVTKSINEPGKIYSGAPAYPIKEFNRIMAHIRNLPKIVNEIKEFKSTIENRQKGILGWFFK